MKRTIILLLAILLIGAGWTAAWHYVEDKVVDAMDQTVARFAEESRVLSCDNRDTHGFPFRIGINCSIFSYQDRIRGFSIEAGETKSVAQFYQPGRVLIEVSDPMTVRLPDGQALTVQWDSMRASASANLDGLSRFSMAGKDVSVLSLYSAGAPTVMDRLLIHGRKQGDNDLQLAASAESFESNQTTFPKLDASITTTLENAYSELLRRPDIAGLVRREGLSGTIDTLRYAPQGSGSLELSGPFQLSRSGVLNGKFRLTMTEGPKVFQTLAAGMPRYREQFELARDALLFLGKAGSGRVTLPLSVKNGQVTLGLIPVGDIGPLL